MHDPPPADPPRASADAVAEGAFDRFARLAARTVGARTALLLLHDGRRHALAGAAGADGSRLPPAVEALCDEVLDGRRRTTRAGSAGPSVACVPLAGPEGEVRGALCALDAGGRTWHDDDLAALEDVAAAVTGHLRLREELRAGGRGREPDGLTGLADRRRFVEALAVEIERGSREGHGPGVVVLHLEGVGAANARGGEGAGDALLADAARAVARALRTYDLAARWGGPRIAVLAPGVTDDAGLRAIGVKLRAAIGDRAGAVSAGAACVGPELSDPAALMDAAEDALAQARARGRGGLRVHAHARRGARATAQAAEAARRASDAVAADGAGPEALGLVAREAGTLAGGDAAFVLRYIAGGRVEILGQWRAPGTPPAGHLSVMALRDASAAALVRTTGRSGRVRSDADRRIGCVERIAAPVRRGGEPWGAVVAVSRRVGAFPPAGEAALAELGEAVGMALSSIASGDRIVTETAATILSENLDAEATLAAVAEAARRALGADRASCYEHSDDQRRISAVHTTETDPDRRRALERATELDRPRLPYWHRLLASSEPTLVVEDVAGGDDPEVARALGVGALIGVRLEHSSLGRDGQSTLLGSLFLSYREPRRFSALELATARSLAGLAGLAVANARLHAMTAASLAEAEERAAIDGLTGLANHRTFQERLRGEIARCRREGRNLALVIFDLDHFKSVNDRHGHQAGDLVLTEFARRLATAARPSDLVARVGGEEFAWVLPGADAAQGWEAAERLRLGMAEEPLPAPRLITVSSGVCDLTDARDAEELYRLADGALYCAKAHGRDTCLRYSTEAVRVLSAQEQADRLERHQALTSVRALARVVDAKDPSTRRHSGRVADLAARVATVLGWPAERTVALRDAGLVHDVGKIGVPDRVLFKPGRLDADEYEQVKAHAGLGAEIVAEVLGREAVTWVRGHHERWGGGGYPDGLVGEAIPEGARILALADSWDVMVNVRHYREPMTEAEALEECRRHAGGQFWPPAVAALERLIALGALGAGDEAGP